MHFQRWLAAALVINKPFSRNYISLSDRGYGLLGFLQIIDPYRVHPQINAKRDIRAAESTLPPCQTNTIPTSLIHRLRAVYEILEVGASDFIFSKRHVKTFSLSIGGCNQHPGQCRNRLDMRISAGFIYVYVQQGLGGL